VDTASNKTPAGAIVCTSKYDEKTQYKPKEAPDDVPQFLNM
jgi:hypothetical protein